MSFGTRLKEKRESLGITQPQLAEMLNVSKGAIGNWETDVNSPRATLLYDLFDILHCDANYLFQDETRELYKNEATPEEFEKLVKPYRSLDPHGQQTVDIILDREAKRSAQAKEAQDRIAELENQPAPILPLREPPAEYLGNAAHARTDLSDDERTPELAQLEEDMIDSRFLNARKE